MTNLNFANACIKWMQDVPQILNIKSKEYDKASKMFEKTIRLHEKTFDELFFQNFHLMQKNRLMEILQEIGNTARGKMVEMNIRYSFDENDITQEFNKIKEIFESQKTEGIEDFIQLCNALLEEDEAQIGLIMSKYHDHLKKYLTRNGNIDKIPNDIGMLIFQEILNMDLTSEDIQSLKKFLYITFVSIIIVGFMMRQFRI